MDAKFFGAVGLAIAITISAVIPVGAKSCGNNGRGYHKGWQNQNRGNHYGWRNNPGRFADRMGTFTNVSNNNFGNGFGAYGSNGLAARPYWGQQTDLTSKVQRIQDRLASGNLSPDKAARLQAQLTRLQGQQSGLNNYWNNRLTSEQQYLQQLLSSGTLAPNQQARVQDRLNRILNVQNGIASGTGFYNNPGMLGSLRGILGF